MMQNQFPPQPPMPNKIKTYSSKNDDTSSSGSDSRSSDSSSRERKKKKKDKKKALKKPKLTVDTMEDYQNIVRGENLQQKLRIDCYCMMLMLIQEQDMQLKNIFERHLNFMHNNQNKYDRFQNKDQSSLLPELIEKTESVFQFFLQNQFNNEQ